MMPAPDGPRMPARLLALRLHGFKSFAERTHVEFGPGISAVVGPNGSGKSNLADSLRWALGEQGRALRSRKAEDVIWAGSERRSAVGMADVQLVIDNADGLLPVEYSVVELGRRLFRSGENEYLLNRVRVRLRDLVELLDAAHLADNAFLFIGQGMVDQALALRPEERRPLFEEVAGVRRHERRRRRAEDQLAESESNLARVEDILAELRPQVRRLAAQAEQQTTRRSAGDELLAALLASAAHRWHEASRLAAAAAADGVIARADRDRGIAALAAAEDALAVIAARLEARLDDERRRRDAHDEAQATLNRLRLSQVRVAGEMEGVSRDRARLTAEREAADADLIRYRRAAASGGPTRDEALEASLADADRLLAEALAELGSLRAATRARDAEQAAVRRAAAIREAEAEATRRRHEDALRRADEAERERGRLGEVRVELEAQLAAARDAVAAAVKDEAAATAEVERCRAASETAEADRAVAAARAASTESAHASAAAALASQAERLAAEEARGIARAARQRGGRRVDASIAVDPSFRAAVEAALGEAVRAYVVARDVVADLAGERGLVIVEGKPAGETGVERRLRDRVAELGGGWLDAALRRDDVGAARAILSRAAWLPDLAACLAIQGDLDPGWLAVPRDGSAVVGDRQVVLGAPEGVLERRAAIAAAERDLAATRTELAERTSAAKAAEEAAASARQDLDVARRLEAVAGATRRQAEEAERRSARAVEAAIRELGWQEAQAGRARAEADRLGSFLSQDSGHDSAGEEAGEPSNGEATALGAWEARAAELRVRRDRLAEASKVAAAAQRAADAERLRAQAGVTAAEERLERAALEGRRLDDLERRLRDEERHVGSELARAIAAEAALGAELEAVLAADAADRALLAAAEREAVRARERLRATDDRARAADHLELQAEVGRAALREGLLVEFAALGELGIRGLATAAGVHDVAETTPTETTPTETTPTEATATEELFEAAARTWAASAPSGEPPPPGRVALLRRRFAELGGANASAVVEYESLRTRMDALEGQRDDLRRAIDHTRRLIAELNTMIASQFTTTFAALEGAFDARFRQLFGGGFARLALTDPTDLAATGVEIVVRPPGKKPQTLAMLSGGERALTAVALLFAMLEVRPVPFCVLDEVDAALDEANVGRFTAALRTLAARTQFIVITHNRGTIEAADALYGVTVGDDSVSRVISLRLDEAQAIASRRRPAAVDAPA